MELSFCGWTLAIEVSTLRHSRRPELWVSFRSCGGYVIRREKEALIESTFTLTAAQLEELLALTVQSGILERKLVTDSQSSPEDLDFYITLTCHDGRQTMAWTETCELFGVEGPDGKGIMALVYALKKATGVPGNLMG